MSSQLCHSCDSYLRELRYPCAIYARTGSAELACVPLARQTGPYLAGAAIGAAMAARLRAAAPGATLTTTTHDRKGVETDVVPVNRPSERVRRPSSIGEQQLELAHGGTVSDDALGIMMRAVHAHHDADLRFSMNCEIVATWRCLSHSVLSRRANRGSFTPGRHADAYT